MIPISEHLQTGKLIAVAQVLSAAKLLPAWGQEPGAAAGTLYEALVREKDIVRMVLLLTGAITSTKQGVDDFAGSFDCFSFLWLKDLAGEYAAFLATNPNLEVCTAQCLASFAQE